MVLLRLRSDDGLVGLGEAVPLSLRGGASLARGRRRAGAAERARSARRGAAAQRCRRPLGAGPLRRADRADRPAGASGPRRKPSSPARRDRSRAMRRWSRASRRRSRRRRALGRGGLLHLQAEARHRRRRRPGAGGARGGRPGARIRVDANAAWDVETAKRTLGEMEPLDVELAEQPVATLEGAAEVARRPRSRSPATRASRAAPMPSGRSRSGACALTGIKLSKVGGPEAGDRDRRGPARLRLQRPRRPGRDRRGRAGGRRRCARAAGGRPRPRPRPRDAAPLRLDRRLGRVRAARRHAAPASRPGLGVEIDEARSTPTASSLAGRL